MNLTQLVEAAKQKDEAAMEALLKRVARRGKYIALDKMKDEDAAEEALQESFIHVYKYLDSLKNPEAFDSWFYMIVRNQCYTLLEKRKKAHITFSTFDTDDMNFEEAVPSEYMEFEPKENFDYSELVQSVKKELDKLPDVQRQAIQAYYFEKLTLQQIADIYKVAESTIRVRINKGIHKIAATVKRLEDQMAAFNFALKIFFSEKIAVFEF